MKQSLEPFASGRRRHTGNIMHQKSFFKSLVRRKYLATTDVTATKLERCLTTFDLTFLGVGSTLGLGIYVLAGQAASTKAGPAVTVSFLIAAIASVFSALCYAEFGARVPKAGSAYVYSYVTVGEFMAFIIGWNLVLEYVIGTASVARGYSGYLDYLVNGTIQRHLEMYMPMYLPGLSTYPDFLSFGITMLLTIMLAVGVKESTRFNNIFTVLNLFVVLYAVICGSFKANLSNWNLKASEIPSGYGSGGFMPYGFSGIMEGASMCFYGYVGFDCIATTGEEAKNPQRAIPRSIIASLSIVFAAYFGVSAVQTLMWPYYDQYKPAPLPYVFQMVNYPVARWLISIGALTGLSTSLLGGMFPLPRILYAMATDGLIFRKFANVHPRFKTPVLATIISGIFAGAMAMMFDVHALASMMSIGTLLAYTLVAVSVLLLRYRILDERVSLVPVLRKSQNVSMLEGSSLDPQKSSIMQEETSMEQTSAPAYRNSSDSQSQSITTSVNTIMSSSTQYYSSKEVFNMIFNVDKIDIQNSMSSYISVILISVICFLLFVLNFLILTLQSLLFDLDLTCLLLVTVTALLILVPVYALAKQPSEQKELHFRVPGVPYIPILSVFININLMLNLSMDTWIRFAVWMIIGFVIYFGYGINNSSEKSRTTPVLPIIHESEMDEEEDDGIMKHERSPLLNQSL